MHAILVRIADILAASPQQRISGAIAKNQFVRFTTTYSPLILGPFSLPPYHNAPHNPHMQGHLQIPDDVLFAP
jgi:hypothetical protein